MQHWVSLQIKVSNKWHLRGTSVDNSAIWWRLLLNFTVDLKQILNSLTTESKSKCIQECLLAYSKNYCSRRCCKIQINFP